jgi:hypothetical protein
MKSSLFATALFLIPVSAQEAKPTVPPTSVEKAPAGDFIRYQEGEGKAYLQTAVKRYLSPEGVRVDLIGVVHIADAAYYQDINERLTKYDSVLYELVGDPEALKNPAAAKAANPLRGIQKMAGNLLKLSFQLDQIDYSKPNFIHADLSAEEFSKLQDEKGENLMSLLSRAMKMEKEGGLGIDEKELDLDLPQLLGLLSGSGSDNLKILMAKVFDKAEAMVEQFEGKDSEKGTVILTERNKKVMAKLEETMKGGKKSLAIFYGAGHLPGLETMLLEQKFKADSEAWLNAWTMTKPAAIEKKADAAK